MRRGSLNLSVNAIVILIMAIAILGLSLGFIKGTFDKLTKDFEGAAAEEPDPAVATADEPLTMSRERIIMGSEEVDALKVGVYNTEADAVGPAGLLVDCIPALDVEFVYSSQTRKIQPQETADYVLLIESGKVPVEKTFNCDVKVGTGVEIPRAYAGFIITVG